MVRIYLEVKVEGKVEGEWKENSASTLGELI